MKKSLLVGLVMAVTLGVIPQAYSEHIQSLRGAVDLDAKSTKVIVKKNINDQEPIERDYVQQPPLIPHKTKGYKINLKFNKCLTCHSWDNYKEAGATKISLTHFADRSDNAMSNVAARRYFCTQCHVTQADAKPLVANEFTPVSALRK